MKRIKVLNFHEINTSHEIKWFEDLVIYLKEKKKIISCDDLHVAFKENISIKDSFLLTVDDGHISFLKNIFPIIEKHQVPISLFVSPLVCGEKKNFWYQEMSDFDEKLSKKIISEILNISLKDIDDLRFKSILKSVEINVIYEYIKRYQKVSGLSNKPFKNMDVNDLLEVNKSPLVTIGGHTMNHPILANESDNSSEYEISGSIHKLSDILNEEVKYFAYPNGIPELDYSSRETAFAKANGIKLSFSTKFRKVRRNSNLMEIPRGELSSGKFSVATKILIWNYWRDMVNLKNGQKDYNDRIQMKRILKRRTFNQL